MTTYREIEIRGSLMARFYSAGTPYGHHGNIVTGACTVAGDVIRQIDAAQVDGAGRLLLVFDCFGGEIPSAYLVAERVRRFSREVGPVIAFVTKADSSAPVVALAADYLVLALDGRIALHGAGVAPENDPGPVNAAMGAALAARTGTDARLLATVLDDLGPKQLAAFEGEFALRTGFADEIGTLERAREVVAGPVLPQTARSRRLAALAMGAMLAACDGVPEEPLAVSPDVAASATQSSDGASSQWPPGMAEIRLHEISASNWDARTTPTGSWTSLTTGGSRLLAVRDNVTADNVMTSDDEGATWTARTIDARYYRGAAHNGSVFCAVSPSTFGYSATSANGEAWTVRNNMPTAIEWTRVVNVGAVFVAFGYGPSANRGEFVSRSTDNGVTWSAAVKLSSADIYPGTMSVAGNTILVPRRSGSAGATCWQSTDAGQSWTLRTIAAGPFTWTASIALGANVVPNVDGLTAHVQFLAVVLTSASTSDPWTVFESTDGGETWAEVGTVHHAGILMWTGRVWVSFSNAGRVYTTYDARVWETGAVMPGAVQQNSGMWIGTRCVTVGSGTAYRSLAVGSSITF